MNSWLIKNADHKQEFIQVHNMLRVPQIPKQSYCTCSLTVLASSIPVPSTVFKQKQFRNCSD